MKQRGTTKKMGRPIAGRDLQGRPIPVTRYPRIHIHVSHQTDRTLKAVKSALKQSPRVTIEHAIDMYIGRLPTGKRRAVLDALKKQGK